MFTPATKFGIKLTLRRTIFPDTDISQSCRKIYMTSYLKLIIIANFAT